MDAFPKQQGNETVGIDDSSDDSSDSPVIAEVSMQDSIIQSGIHMVRASALNSYEEDLKLEYFAQQVYLIRGVQIAGLSIPEANMAEALAFGMIGRGQATWTQLARLLSLLPCNKTLRWTQDSSCADLPPKRFTTGAYAHGPLMGTTIHSRQFPWVTRALAGVIRTWDSELSFTSVTLSLNVKASPHKDKFNAVRSKNLLLPASTFSGGEVFVEHEEGRHQLQPNGAPGHILSANEALSFSPRRTHATLPWSGTRLVLIAYHIGMINQLDHAVKDALHEMGFQVGAWQ